MTVLARGVASAGLLALAVASPGKASPCDGVDRSLAASDKPRLAQAVATQLDMPNAEILQSFRDGAWRILYIDTHRADEAFLFFVGDPATHRYVTLWSGSAMPNEERSIETWTRSNAANIPARLARCFAWHVTQDRDR